MGRCSRLAILATAACVGVAACGGTADRLTQAESDAFINDRAEMLVLAHTTEAGPKQWALRCRTVLHPPNDRQQAAFERVLAMARLRPTALEVPEFAGTDEVSVARALLLTADDIALCRRRGVAVSPEWGDVETQLRAAARSD